MLVHIGQNEVAAKIRNALFKTIEDGVHTADIYNDKISKKKVGTKEFTNEVIVKI
jgi:isocitrate dehydrogenase